MVLQSISKLFNRSETVRPKYSYDLEEQMFGMMRSQDQGLLRASTSVVESIDLIPENGQGWYIVHTGRGVYGVYFEGHCSEYMSELKGGDVILKIQGIDNRPDIFDGQDRQCMGLILDSRCRTLYRSPGYSYPEPPLK